MKAEPTLREFREWFESDHEDAYTFTALLDYWMRKYREYMEVKK